MIITGPTSKYAGALGAPLAVYDPALQNPRQVPGLQADYNIFNTSGLIYDGSNRVQLVSDSSGNSGENCLALNGVTGNNASFPAITAFGTADFTVSFRFRVLSLAATQNIFGSATNGFAFKLNPTGRVVSSKTGVADNMAASITLTQYQMVTVTYVRSVAGGTYYFNGILDATVADAVNYTVGISLLGQATASNPLTGNLVWARAYNSALNASQVLADANGAVQSNCIFNARFDLQAKLAASFTESSVNAATVTINTTGQYGARICGPRDLVNMTAANQPVLTAGAVPLITFDGTDDSMKAAAFSLSQPTTVYFLGGQVTWTLYESWFDGFTTGARHMNLYQAGTTPTVSLNAGNAGAVLASPTVNTRVVLCAVYNAASSSLSVNTAAAATGDAGNRNANGFTLGSNSEPTGFGNITFTRALLYSGSHDAATKARIIRYLMGQGGVS